MSRGFRLVSLILEAWPVTLLQDFTSPPSPVSFRPWLSPCVALKGPVASSLTAFVPRHPQTGFVSNSHQNKDTDFLVWAGYEDSRDIQDRGALTAGMPQHYPFLTAAWPHTSCGTSPSATTQSTKSRQIGQKSIF